MTKITILSNCLVKKATEETSGVKENVIYFNKIFKIVYETFITESVNNEGEKTKEYYTEGIIFFNQRYSSKERSDYFELLSANKIRIVQKVGSEIPELDYLLWSLFEVFIDSVRSIQPILCFEPREISEAEISTDRTGLHIFNVFIDQF